MTNEEIKLLKNFITWQSLPFVDNLFTHEDEIIKKFDEWLRLNALEQQPCEDTISRKSLSDNLCVGISCNECSFNEIDGE